MNNIANCAVDLATVAIKIPSDVVTNKCRAAPIKNRVIDPSIGTLSQPWTTSKSAPHVETRTTRPIDQTFEIII